MTLHGFAYDSGVEAALKRGETFSREYVSAYNGHRHRVVLSWLEAHDCPHVSDLDMDLVVRVTG